MKFFHRNDLKPSRDWHFLKEGLEQNIKAHKEYDAHLEKISSMLPEETKLFVLSSWYQNPKSHDCPHDAWLQELKVTAKTENEEDRVVNVTMKLLGNCHDRILTFEYVNVIDLNFDMKKCGRHNVGDWLSDEFDLADEGFISHEILWQFGKPWRIVAKNIKFFAENK